MKWIVKLIQEYNPQWSVAKMLVSSSQVCLKVGTSIKEMGLFKKKNLQADHER